MFVGTRGMVSQSQCTINRNNFRRFDCRQSSVLWVSVRYHVLCLPPQESEALQHHFRIANLGSDWVKQYTNLIICMYRIVPIPNFDSSVVCEVLRITAHHAKFLRGDLKVHSLSSCRCFRHHYNRQQGLHTLVIASLLAVRNLHTAIDERCKVMVTRLRVGPFSTRIQLSLLLLASFA